jgi:hypothetical protein
LIAESSEAEIPPTHMPEVFGSKTTADCYAKRKRKAKRPKPDRVEQSQARR